MLWNTTDYMAIWASKRAGWDLLPQIQIGNGLDSLRRNVYIGESAEKNVKYLNQCSGTKYRAHIYFRAKGEKKES